MKPTRRRRLVAFLAGLVALVMLTTAYVAAATLAVTDGGDDGSPGQLRTVIDQAAPGDTIELRVRTVTLLRGEIRITKPLTIEGVGFPTTIDGGNLGRVFSIEAQVRMSRVSVVNGNVVGDPVNANGGGAYVSRDGHLILDSLVTYKNNSARNGGGIYCEGRLEIPFFDPYDVFLFETNNATEDGGAILIAPDALAFLAQATVFKNTSGRGGGGIAVLGGLYMENGVFEKNQGGLGGAISLAEGAGTGIMDTRFIDNAARQGGAMNVTAGATANITGGTFARNRAVTSGASPGFGGAILNFGDTNLDNVTVTDNAADVAGGGLYNAQGADAFSPGAFTARGLTLAGNRSTQSPGSGNIHNAAGVVDVARSLFGDGGCGGAPVTSGGFNIVNAVNDCPGVGGGPGDRVDNELRLDGLKNYGGPSLLRGALVRAPLPGSPAVNGGGPCSGQDARGVARPQGFSCDNGAVEVEPHPAAGAEVDLSGGGVAIEAGQRLTVTCNFLPGTNPSIVRDYYCFVSVPTGSDPLFVSVVPGPNGSLQPTVGPTPMPLATNSTLPQPFTVQLVHDWNGTEPEGGYSVVAATTPVGANAQTPLDQLSLSIGVWRFAPAVVPHGP